LRVLRWRGASALVDVIERAVAVSDAAPDDIAVTALRQAAIQRLMIADPAPAVAHARAALTRAAGDPWLRFLGHEACALSYTQSGLVEQARTHGRAAVALIDGGYGHPDHICTLASALNWCELYADVRRVLAADVDRHRRAGNPHFLVTGLLYLGEMLLRTGDLSAAEPVAREAVEVASRLGDRYLGPMSAALLGYLRVLRGEQDGMRLAREAASAPGDLGMRVITARPLARALLLAGDPAGALAALAPVIQVEPRGYREPNEIRGVGLRLEALVAMGRLDEAHGVLAHVEAAAQGSSTRWTRACAARFRGVLAEDLDEAEVGFGQALSALADEDGPLERGMVLLDQGRRLRRGGRRRDAREVLQAAHTDFTACGARPFAAQAAREIAGTAARLRPRGEPAGVQLTAREAQVARRAAAGATDREIAAALFVSARTVDFHLRNVFRKLGLRTRGELAGRLSDGDIAPSEP
jgi:DNA-binding CsgD family transcriptional regulator